jgi:hypothetical protein
MYYGRVLTMDQLDGVEPIHENWDDVDLVVSQSRFSTKSNQYTFVV